jgi:arsenite methyltransferase
LTPGDGHLGAFVEGRAGITGADVQAWLADLASLGEAEFFSLNRYAFLATTPVTPPPASPG